METIAPYELDDGCGDAARLGLIVLSTDETLENELRHVVERPGLALFHTRIPAHPDVTEKTLRLMEADLPDTARRLPQRLDVIGYACTSGATVIGSQRVTDLVQSHHPDTPVTTPIDAVIAALKHLKACKIALVTPYLAEVTAPIRARLAASGIETLAETSFLQKDDWSVARISEASTKRAMLEVAKARGCDAVFASCTNLRTFGILEEVEAELGLPVVTSNQALIWHMLQIAGVSAHGWGPGRLFAS